MIRLKINLLILCSIVSVIMLSQQASGQAMFTRTIGDTGTYEGCCAFEITNHHYIAIGNATSNNGYSSVYIVELDSVGDFTKDTLIGNGGIFKAVSGTKSQDGSIYICGISSINSVNAYQIMIIKLSNDGRFEWQKEFGNTDWEIATDICIRNNSDLIISYNRTSNDYPQFLICNLQGDSIGNYSPSLPIGYQVMSITDDANNNIIACGHYKESDNTLEAFVTKLDINSDTVWVHTYGDTLDDSFTHVFETPDTGYVAMGYTYGFSMINQAGMAIRFHQDGSFKWSHLFDGNSNESFTSGTPSTDGTFVFGGNTDSYGAGGSDGHFSRSNDGGWYLSSAGYGGSKDDLVKTVEICSDSGFIFCGSTKSFGVAYPSMMVVKTDIMGQTNLGFQLITDIKQHSEKEFITVFPNPTRNIINIQLPLPSSNDINTIQLWSLDGRLVQQMKVNNEDVIQLSLEHLDPGYYFIRISGESDIGSTKILLLP